MKLGELSLYEKKGLFYQGDIMDVPDPGLEVKMVSDPVYLTGFVEGDDLGFSSADRHHAIIPVDIDGSTTYITGAYQDAGNVEGAYVVKVWLLIEEEPNTNQ